MRIELKDTGAPRPGRSLTRQAISGPTMGTRYAVTFYAQPSLNHEALERDLHAAVTMVDEQMSTWNPQSDLMAFNRLETGVWFDMPPQLATVVGAALDIGHLSGGSFDIAIGDLVCAWGFGPARETPEDKGWTAAALEIDGSGRRLRKLATVSIDLSGIAKGFGVDELCRVLEFHGVRHYLASIDGELRAAGGKPDGSPWQVAIEAPEEGRRDVDGTVEIFDGALATSGDYRHVVERDGRRYSHTIDPRTRQPLRNGIASVTVLAPTCMAADAWATALMVLGPQLGTELAAKQGLEVLFMEHADPVTGAPLPRAEAGRSCP